MKEVNVKIKYIYSDVKELYETGEPSYVHEGDSGMDVYAYIPDRNPIVIDVGQTKLVKSGFAVSIPVGYEFQVRSNSGNSLKKNLVVNNSPGTVDSPYRGEIGVILHNENSAYAPIDNVTYDFSPKPIVINHGDKIAQIVLCPVYKCKWDEVDSLDDTTRGEGGFGSTEKK